MRLFTVLPHIFAIVTDIPNTWRIMSSSLREYLGLYTVPCKRIVSRTCNWNWILLRNAPSQSSCLLSRFASNIYHQLLDTDVNKSKSETQTVRQIATDIHIKFFSHASLEALSFVCRFILAHCFGKQLLAHDINMRGRLSDTLHPEASHKTCSGILHAHSYALYPIIPSPMEC